MTIGRYGGRGSDKAGARDAVESGGGPLFVIREEPDGKFSIYDTKYHDTIPLTFRSRSAAKTMIGKLEKGIRDVQARSRFVGGRSAG